MTDVFDKEQKNLEIVAATQNIKVNIMQKLRERGVVIQDRFTDRDTGMGEM